MISELDFHDTLAFLIRGVRSEGTSVPLEMDIAVGPLTLTVTPAGATLAVTPVGATLTVTPAGATLTVT